MSSDRLGLQYERIMDRLQNGKENVSRVEQLGKGCRICVKEE